MKKISYIIGLFLVCFGSIYAQQTPAKKQTETILITGATAHIGNGDVITNSAIGFKDGKLTYVGSTANANKNEYAEVIDATGKDVYPGFIALNSTLGLVEIDAIRQSDDQREIGEIIPHIRSIIAYNAESKVVESMRPNGILMAQITPRGGILSGTSSIVQFDAWNWEDAAIKTDDAIHMNWPNPYTRGRWWMGEDAGMKPNKNYNPEIDKVERFLANAKAYFKGSRTPENLPFEAVEGLLNGKQKLFVHADTEKQIIDAVNFSEKVGLGPIVIVGGYEAHKVGKMLADKKVAVVVTRPHSMPEQEDEDIKQPYKLAKLLVDQGVLVSLDPSGDMERMSTRNLPFYAGTCVAYGLDKEKALSLITSNAAKILGADDTIGTLEVGKDATLFISKGDALDMRTNILSHAFIQGRNISLESHQTQLWKRYMGKYNGK